MLQRPAVPDSVDDVDDDPGDEGEGEEEAEDLEGEVLAVTSSSVATRVAARAVHMLVGGVVESGDVGDCPLGRARGGQLGDHIQNGIHGRRLYPLIYLCMSLFPLCLLFTLFTYHLQKMKAFSKCHEEV